MIIEEKTEQNNVFNSSIVPQNGALSNSINLTQTEIETSKATKTWTGRVSLDDQKYDAKPTDARRINSSIANGAMEIDEYELIEAITSGRSWSPTIFQDGIRKGANFVSMSALVADFDDGFQSLDEIKTRAEEHDLKFSFVHESFSHMPERPKYRGVILLEQPIKDYETAKFYCQYIKHVFKGFVDTSAAEPTRFYYGGREGSLVFQNKGPILSLSTLEQNTAAFKKRLEEEKNTRKTPAKSKPTPKKEIIKKPVHSPQKTGGENINETDGISNADFDEAGLLIVNDVEDHRFIEFDIDDYVEILSVENLTRLLEIKTALEVLDTVICEDYDTWLNIGMALHHEGSTNGNLDFSEAMRELFHAWSQGSDKYEEEKTEKKWLSFGDRDDSIKIKTLFHYAHQKVANVKNLTQKIYPLVDEHYKSLEPSELDAQKQKLTAALKAGDSIEYMDKMPMRQRVSHYIENFMSQDLRYNLHSREFEYKGEILDIHDFHLHLVVAFNKEVSEAIFRKAYEKYANEYAYHPFQEYVEGLLDKNYKPSEEDYQNAVNYLNKVAQEYLHAQNEFEHLLFCKWMLGTVCRVLSPGYKFDGVLMFKGGQGLGKTTFFESIAGLEYYRSHLGSIDKDALAKMHRAIIIELAEIAATFGKVKNEALKNFITERVDTFRRPYGYSDIDHPRRFVFGGSTNDDEFLTDSTGSRRYWVIEINEMIDTAAIREHRDEIFRAAYIMKLHGDEPYLKPEESVTNEERNSTHKKVTLLEEAIAEIVHERMEQQEKVKDTPYSKDMSRIPFLSNDIVKDLKDTHPSLKPTSHGINAALKSVGFEQKHMRVNGKTGRWWEPTERYYEQYQEKEAI